MSARRRWRGLLVPAAFAAGGALLVRAAGAATAPGTAPALRHELAEASATVVVRDGGHVELRLQVPWSDVLRRAWQPRAQPVPFLGEVVALAPTVLARRLDDLQRRLAADTRVAGGDETGVPLGRWQWPAPEALRDALQRELMSRVADGSAYEHASRLPATAEAKLPRSPRAVRVRLSALLGPALVTVLQPREQWVAPGAWSVPAPLTAPGSGTLAAPSTPPRPPTVP